MVLLVAFPAQAWCRENFLHLRNMKTVLDVRRQLKELCQRLGVGQEGAGLGSSRDSGVLLRSLLGGLFTNVADHTGEGKYLTVSISRPLHEHAVGGIPRPFILWSDVVYTTQLKSNFFSWQLGTRQAVYIHPSSSLFHTRPHPHCLMYSQLVHTTKCYMR